MGVLRELKEHLVVGNYILFSDQYYSGRARPPFKRRGKIEDVAGSYLMLHVEYYHGGQWKSAKKLNSVAKTRYKQHCNIRVESLTPSCAVLDSKGQRIQLAPPAAAEKPAKVTDSGLFQVEQLLRNSISLAIRHGMDGDGIINVYLEEAEKAKKQ